MGYRLGIDLGTTYTAAALCRDGRAEMLALGDRSPVIPSVVAIREDGTVLTGEAAERRVAIEPDRVGREFKRRFGDPAVRGGAPLPLPRVRDARLARRALLQQRRHRR